MEPALEAVMKKSENVSYLNQEVKGYEWKNGIDYEKILNSYLNCGFQATNFGLAVNEINKMLSKRRLPLQSDSYEDKEDEFVTVKSSCTIFLGYTSNIVSSGLRETIKFLVQHKLVCFYTQNVIVHIPVFNFR